MSTINTAPPPPPAANRFCLNTVESAVNALLKWRNSKSKTQKPQLLEQDDCLYLVLTLKKIPQSRTNPHKIPLPHPLIRHEDDNAPEICLIIDDRTKSNLTKDAAMKKIKNDNIPISKVIKITKLKTDYRPFEAKRKLCDSYDMFFADKRVVPLLPKLLGKQFFKKKKLPVPLDLTHKNWKEQMDRICGSALLYLKTGTCSVLKTGKVSMGPKEIVENVAAAINRIAEIVPRKWGNIRSFHLKVTDSLALPIYHAMPDLKLRIDGVKAVEEEVVNDELDKGNVKDAKSDSNKKKSKKGRIHEVRYMDSNIGEVLDEDELGSIVVEGDIGEIHDSENDQLDGGEVRGQKRKKGDKAKVEKPLKKKAKMKKEDGIEGRKDQKLPKKVSKGKKEDGGIGDSRKDENVVKKKKQKKEELSSKRGEEDSSGKKEKKSLLGKLKSPELKLKDKKEKKKRVA